MAEQHYVILIRWTQGGLTHFEDTHKNLDAAEAALNTQKGKFVNVLFCLGEYDAVVIVTAPSVAVVAAFTLALGSVGAVQTTTLHAFDREGLVPIFKTATKVAEAYIGGGGGAYIGGGHGDPA